MQTKLSKRSQQILSLLTELYIKDGQPIGSKTLAASNKLNCSSATIRNTMSELENLGLLVSPHTSAGRIPTVTGYRFFVNNLLKANLATSIPDSNIKQQIQGQVSNKNIIETASGFLSGITNMAGIVTMPRHNKIILRHIEFLKLNDKKILVIMVLNDGEVQNRILLTDKSYNKSELEQASNFLTRSFSNLSLSEIRSLLLKQMQTDKNSIDYTMQLVLDLANQTLTKNEKENTEFVLAGENQLIGMTNDNDVASLQNLFSAFKQKQEILSLLNQCISANGVQIYIGEESGIEPLGGYSIITAPYNANDQCFGVLGVIGPTRMKYDKVIPIVDMTAKLISNALEIKS